MEAVILHHETTKKVLEYEKEQFFIMILALMLSAGVMAQVTEQREPSSSLEWSSRDGIRQSQNDKPEFVGQRPLAGSW